MSCTDSRNRLAMALVAPILYLALAALAILLPESRFPEDDYYSRMHHLTFPLEHVVALLTLWILALIVWGVVAAYRGRNWPWYALVIPLIPVIGIAIWVRPPFTHDVYIYACQGREAVVMGASPYTVPLAAFHSRDSVIGSLSKTWIHLTSVFGPLAMLIYCFACLLSPAANLHQLGRVLKTFWILPFCGVFYLFWKRWSSLPQRNAMMLAVLANPIMMLFVFWEGHVDILFLLLLLLSGLGLDRRQPYVAALWLCAATSVKFSAIVMVPACACWLWHRDHRKGVQFFVTFLVSYGMCSALINAGDLRSFLGFSTMPPGIILSQCVPRALIYLVGSYSKVKLYSDLVFFALIGAICLANFTGRARSSPFQAMAMSTAALYYTRTYTMPWYTMWFWPLLWFTTRKSRNLYLSVALWTTMMLLVLMNAMTWRYNVWISPVAFLVSLIWLHDEDSTRSCPESDSDSPAPTEGQEHST